MTVPPPWHLLGAALTLSLLVACGQDQEEVAETPSTSPPATQVADQQPETEQTERQVGDAGEAVQQQQQEQQQQQQTAKQDDAEPATGQTATEVTFPRQTGAVLALRIETPEPQVPVGESQALHVVVENRSDQPLRDLRLRPHLSPNFQIDRIARKPGARQRPDRAADERAAGDQPQDQPVAQPETTSLQIASGSLDFDTLHLSRLEPGASDTFILEGVATEPGRVEIAFDATWADQAEAVVAFEAVRPDLELERRLAIDSGSTDRLYACDQASLHYRLTNTGNAPAERIELREPLPLGVTTAEGERQVAFTIDRLSPDQSWNQEVPLQVSGNTTWEGRATANFADHTVHSQRIQVEVVEPEAEIQVRVPERARADSPVEIAIEVRNTGSHPIEDARLVLPDHPLFAQATLRGFADSGIDESTIPLGDLTTDTQRNFTIVLEASEPTRVDGEIALEARCVSAQSRPVTIDIQGVPALQVEVIDAEDPIAVGGETTYRVRVTNEGSAPIEQVQVRGTLSQHLEALGLEDGGEIQVVGSEIELPVDGTLEPGQSREWSLRAKARSSGQGRIQLQVASVTLDHPVTEYEPTTIR